MQFDLEKGILYSKEQISSSGVYIIKHYEMSSLFRACLF